MKDSNYRITLDVKQTQSQVTIPVKINDASRKLYISLTEGGTPYIISESCFAVLSGIKSDGTDFLNNCIIEDNVIRYDFTPQTVSAQGMVECEVILYDANGGLLVSPHLTIIVDERACRASSSASYNEHTFIDQALEAEAIRQTSEAARATAEASRVSAENTRQSQETERTEAEFLRTLEEETRASNEEERKTNEAKRVSSETSRMLTEVERSSQERNRENAENYRNLREKDRIEAEKKREIAIETAKAMAIVCEASGEVITLNDASNSPLSNLKVFGRTTQKTTTGKNKLPSEAKTLVQNGITFTANGDGTVTANGTAIDGAEMKEPNKAVILPAGKYILNGCQGGSNNTYYLFVATINDGGVYERLATDIGSGASFELTTARNVFFILRVLKGVTVSNIVFKPMVRLATNTDSTYEQYTGGIPSPNPNYPQNLISVGDSGSFEVGVYGGNIINEALFAGGNGTDYAEFVDGKIHFVNASGNKFTCASINLLLPKGTYYLNMKAHSHTTQSSPVGIGTTTEQRYLNGVSANTLEYKFDKPTYLNIKLTTQNFNEIGEFYANVWLVAEKNCDYQPYVAKQTLTMPYPLRSYGGVKDEIDFVRGVLIQRCYMATDFSFNFELENVNVYRASKPYPTDYANALCSHTNVNENTNNDNTHFYIGNSAIWAYLPKDADVSNLQVLCKLETPLEIPLSETELNVYRQLHTNKPNTIILNSESAHQEVTYVADTKTYIDKKIAELTATVDEGVV